MDNPRTPPPPPPPPKAPPSHPHLTRTTSANVLDKYELGRVLGRGSFAKVYAAKSLREQNKDVAIKVIDKSRVVPAMERRVICEIIAMKLLQHHPNILKIYEVMATKTKIYLVMDLAAGGELFSKILHRGKLKEPAARRLFQQLVSALHFCHQNGVAHRDLKPQNLLLDAQGNLKISDFGLSALAEANGVLHTACGTPAFAAPEVMARRGYDGAKADAWSCGVILFFLLSNCLPFDDSNLVTMYKKIYKREYSMPSCISKPAKSVISQLLEPNPKRRMSTEELMNHPWLVKKLELPRPRSMFELRGYEGKECMINDALSINAFDIISLSSGLDLSGLFEVSNRKDKRFTSRKRVEDVKERLTEVGGKLGYKVEEGKDGVIGFGKGRLALVFEVLMIVERIAVVEVKVVEGGGVEFDEAHWRELEDGLQDVVLQWNHQEVVRSKDQPCCSVEVDDARWTESEEGP